MKTLQETSNQNFDKSQSNECGSPVRGKGRMNGLDRSPEIDYYCSPIPVPCTQDGNNEVAWDWQGSELGRQKKNTKVQKVLDTPTRSGLEQKKRNSPLLQKPLKRKLIAKESNENIGKFAAQLKALNEDLKQKTCAIQVDNKEPTESQLIVQLDSNGLIDCVEDKLHIENDLDDKFIGSQNSFEDLFEDGIEESLVRCSQEIEEKFHLRHSINRLKRINYEFSSSSENDIKVSISDSSSTSESSFRKSDNFHPRSGSLLFDVSSNSDQGISTNTENCQSNSPKTCSKEDRLSSSNNGQCDFPDDSFDDLILTCVDEAKLISKTPTQSLRRINNNGTYSSSVCNKAVPSLLPKAIAPSNSISNKNYPNQISHHSNNFTKKIDDANTIEGRKFFKTKSLSESYFDQTSPTKKRKINKITSNTKSNNTPLKTGQPNNSANKKGGNTLSRYHSAQDLKTNYEPSSSQTVHCTSEQIEMKRIQAKMRLEAKRKLFSKNLAVSNLLKNSSNRNINR